MASSETDRKQSAARCWVCGSTQSVSWKSRSLPRRLAPEDLRITDHRYGLTLSLRRCPECDFIFADDEEVGELAALYEALSDPDYEKSQMSRALQMQWLLDAALRANPGAQSLLDVGAGTGLLVAEARRRGLEATGVERSRTLVQAARAHNQVELWQGFFPHPGLSGRRFDLVFLVDVIEHVSNPLELLRACAQALNPSGLVVVVTPDVGSLAARMLGKRWWHFRLAHVGYFSQKSLSRLSEAAGVAPVRQFRAKWFFPVSYLADRVAEYVPVGWLNRKAQGVAPLRWLYQQVMPLNLGDSFVVLLAQAASRTENATR